jgi:chromosome segregation ATPase
MKDQLTVSVSYIEDLTEQINTLKVQLRDEQMQSKFWEDNHAKLEEKLRIQYDAEFEAFKVSFENRIRDEYEQKLNEAAHADASEITSLHKELDKRDESIKNLIRINNNITDEVNNQFNHLAEKHAEISNLAQELEHYKISLGKMTNLMLDRDEQIERLRTRYNDMETRWMAAQAKYSNKLESDINDGKNSSHEHSDGKGGWSV